MDSSCCSVSPGIIVSRYSLVFRLLLYIFAGVNVFSMAGCKANLCRAEDPSCDAISAVLLASSIQCTYRSSWSKIGSTEGNPDGLVAVTFSSIVQGPDGALYAGGEASNGNDAAVVMRSDDNGANWVTEWLHQPTVNPAAITQMFRAADGSLLAIGNHNPDSTNTEVFVARKPPGGSFSIVSAYERQNTHVSRALNATLSSTGTIYAVGNAADAVDIAGIVLSSGGDYSTLNARTLLNDGANPVLFSAAFPDSDASISVAGFIDLGASKDFTVGISESNGTYTTIVRDTLNCCLGDPELHDPTGLYRLSNGNLIMGLTPGTSLADIRATVMEIAPNGSYFRTEVSPAAGAATSLKIHGNSQVVSQFLPSGATGTAQVSIRKPGESGFTVSFPANTDGIILNDAPEESIRLVETHLLDNGDLVMPLPIHNSIVASEPAWFYRFSCR